MIAGFAALLEQTQGRPRRVLGIDASATIEETRDQVARIARNIGKLIELGRDLTDDEITLMEGWAGTSTASRSSRSRRSKRSG
jgi:1-aminocyclopropane-1-carboxylate deaminase